MAYASTPAPADFRALGGGRAALLGVVTLAGAHTLGLVVRIVSRCKGRGY